jgi:hypothetical protein
MVTPLACGKYAADRYDGTRTVSQVMQGGAGNAEVDRGLFFTETARS